MIIIHYSACSIVAIGVETAFHNNLLEGATVGVTIAKNTSFEIHKEVNVDILSVIFGAVEHKR